MHASKAFRNSVRELCERLAHCPRAGSILADATSLTEQSQPRSGSQSLSKIPVSACLLAQWPLNCVPQGGAVNKNSKVGSHLFFFFQFCYFII